MLSLLEDLFDLDCSVTTNRNAAPSEFVEVLIKEVDRAVELRRMKWWFTPAWFGSLRHRYTTFNARSERVKKVGSTRMLIVKKGARYQCQVILNG